MTRERTAAALASAIALVSLASCSCASGPTLWVDLRTNYVPGVEFQTVRTQIDSVGGGDIGREASHALELNDAVRVGLRVATLADVVPGVYEVRVTLLDAGGSSIGATRLRVRVRDATLVTAIVTRDCTGIACGEDEFCVGMRCIPFDCGQERRPECPPALCDGDADCSPAVSCAVAACLEGTCQSFGDPALCGPRQYCHPEQGCLPLDRMDAGVPLDGGPPPTCPPTGCNDNNICTDDSCVSGRCAFTPNTADCGDGVFCNGTDRCSGGTCSVHSGDPCPSQGCDEANRTCVCRNDGDCPTRIEGPYGNCGGFTDVCDMTGSQVRTVTTYRCVSGTCDGSDTTEMQACTRGSTDGTMCGATNCDTYGACDYADACDESAVQARTCTDSICAGGACAARPRTETRGCSRMTSGMSCGARSCGGWGGCDYADDCDQDGQESQTCTDYACSGGTCRGTSTRMTRDCMRSTEGQTCGSNPTYCGRPTNCHVCRGGSCAVNTPHFNASCNPSCGAAISLCGVPGICCTSVGSCTSVGPGPFADAACANCCEGDVCY